MLENLIPAPKRCKVTKIWETLEPADQQILSKALADEEHWSAVALERALKSKGLSVSNDTILAHRHRICQCEEVRA